MLILWIDINENKNNVLNSISVSTWRTTTHDIKSFDITEEPFTRQWLTRNVLTRSNATNVNCNSKYTYTCEQHNFSVKLRRVNLHVCCSTHKHMYVVNSNNKSVIKSSICPWENAALFPSSGLGAGITNQEPVRVSNMFLCFCQIPRYIFLQTDILPY